MSARAPTAWGADRGAVTVEAAIGLCAVIVTFGLVLAAMAAVVDQIRCVDAAVQAARVIARGEAALAGQVVAQLSPAGASLTSRVDGEQVTVDVSAEPASGLLPGLTLHAEAVALLEPGVSPTGEPPTVANGSAEPVGVGANDAGPVGGAGGVSR